MYPLLLLFIDSFVLVPVHTIFLSQLLSAVQLQPQYIGVHIALGLEERRHGIFISLISGTALGCPTTGRGQLVSHVLNQQLNDGVSLERVEVQQLQKVPDPVHQLTEDPPR